MTMQQLNRFAPQMERSYSSAARTLASARASILASEFRGDSADRAKTLNDRRLSIERIGLLQEEIKRIEEARRRMEQGTFGVCVDCLENISESRLLAIPWADRCFACKRADDNRLAQVGA